jgi:hypothetical protein
MAQCFEGMPQHQVLGFGVDGGALPGRRGLNVGVVQERERFEAHMAAFERDGIHKRAVNQW